MEDNLITEATTQTGALLAVAYLIAFIVWRLLNLSRPTQSFFRRFPWGGAAIDLILLPAGIYGLGRLVVLLLDWMNLSTGQNEVGAVTGLLIVLAVSSGVARLIELWMVSQSPEICGGNRESKLPQLGRIVLFGLSMFVGTIIYLAVNDYMPTGLYVSTGAAAALVAFAMQQTLGDLFSGIALGVERSFKIGDWLRFSDGMEGEVMDVNWRATRLRGWDNTTYVVPNGQLSRQSFTNLHGSNHRFSPWYLVRVSGDADPQIVKALLEKAVLKCDAVLRSPAPVSRLMDGTSNPYTYMVWVHFPDYPSMFAGREQLYREIHRTLRAEGLQISTDINEIRHRPVEEPNIDPVRAPSIG